jgi:hypothetical protein
MLSKWENKYREHWPHHYRDVLDKLNSALGMVVVSDTQNPELPGQKPVATLEKSFKEPHQYTIKIQDGVTQENLLKKTFATDEIEKSVEEFVALIGGWQER